MSRDHSFQPSHGMCPFAWNFYVSMEFYKIQYWPVIGFTLKFKFKFVKLSDKTANLQQSAKLHCNTKKYPHHWWL